MNIMQKTSVLQLCRLCGTEIIKQNKTINIFDTNGVALKIKSKIINCLGLDVSENDLLPKVLCKECFENLEKYNEFKIKSNKTALHFKDLLTKQVSFSVDELSEEIDIKQESTLNIDSETDVHIKLENENPLSNIQPTFQIQLHPIPKLSRVHRNPPRKVKKSVFRCNKNTVSTRKKSIDQINTAHKNINNKIKVKSNTKKSKPKLKKVEILKDYNCEHCPRVCNTRDKFLKHIKNHLETYIDYTCKICGSKLKSKHTLNSHMKIKHSKQYKYVCNYCGKGYIDKGGFDYHVRTTHTKDYPFQCNKCDNKYASKHNLKFHIETKHNEVYKYTCEICNKPFKVKSFLHNHKKMHLPREKRLRFKCNVCNETFMYSQGLKRHMYGHTGELTYGCEFCNKRYKDKPGIKVHLLTHTGERNHICDVCGKAFAIKTNLVVHQRIHNAERPLLKCNACDKTFTYKCALIKHSKRTCPGKVN